MQEPKPVMEQGNFCPVEHIGEWNGVHYYYAYRCPPDGSGLHVVVSGTYYGTLNPYDPADPQCPCPVTGTTIVVFLPDGDGFKKQARKQVEAIVDAQVVASRDLHRWGMASYVGKKKEGGNPGEGEDFSSTFKAKVAVKKIEDDTEEDHEDGGVKRRYRLLRLTLANPNHPGNEWTVRIGMQRTGAKKEPYSESITVKAHSFFVLRPNKHVGGG